MRFFSKKTYMSLAMVASCAFPVTLLSHGVTDTGVWSKPGQFFITHTGNVCTAGFAATDDAKRHYFITAGYCFRSLDYRVHEFLSSTSKVPALVFNPGDMVNPVGFEKVWFNPGDNNFIDISLVEMYPNRTLGDHRTVKGGTDGTYTDNGFAGIPVVVNSAEEKNGDPVCVAGRNQPKPACGYVTGTHISKEIAKTSIVFTNLVNAHYFSDYGDSGAAVYSPTLHTALGIHVAHGMHNPSNSFYVPIGDVLAKLRTKIPSLRLVGIG